MSSTTVNSNSESASSPTTNSSYPTRLEQQLSNSSQYNAIYQHYLASLMAANSGSLNNNVLNSNALKINTSNSTPTSLNNGNNSLNSTNSTSTGQFTNHHNNHNDTCTLSQSIAKLPESIVESKNQTPIYFV